MIKTPLDDLNEGEELAVDVKIRSRHPDSLYRLRIEEGSVLEKKHLSRLEKAGVPYVFVKNPNTNDLNEKIFDRDLDQAEENVLDTLENIQLKVQSDDETMISTEELTDSLEGLIENLRKTNTMMIFQTLKSHHDYTVKHSLEVAKLSLHIVLSRQKQIHEMLMEETGASPSYTLTHMVEDLGLGALLHDTGKWKIPTDVLDKRDDLDLQEWNAIKKHPEFGKEIIQNSTENIRSPVYAPILGHHEKFAGDGYPKGAMGDTIHLYARITACCDVFSALTSKRPYRIALTPNRAIQTMHDMQKDTLHFDPEIFSLFEELVPPFPIGQKVVLSDGTLGVVTELGENWQRPTVRVLKEKNDELDEPYEITANREDSPKIVN